MKVVFVLILTICGALAAPQIRADGDEDVDISSETVLSKAFGCDPEECRLPSCKCSSTVLDPNIPIENTPQVRNRCELGSVVKHFEFRKYRVDSEGVNYRGSLV